MEIAMSDEEIINEINEILVYLEDEGEYHLDKDCDTEWLLAVKEVLNLFNRQQAEIEKLENAIIALMSYLDILGADKTDTSFINQATEFNKQIRADIKSEAIKEFAERLRKEAVTKCDWDNCVDVEDIDRLVAEMVGGENA